MVVCAPLLAFVRCRANLVPLQSAAKHRVHPSVPRLDSYDGKTRLREEIEAPFAKLRTAAYPVLLAAAALATSTQLAATAKNRAITSQDAGNLAIDTLAIAATAFLWKTELDNRQKRLRRISAGARLAALRIRLFNASETGIRPIGDSSLSELRSGRVNNARRIVVVCAEQEALLQSCREACDEAPRLASVDIVIVPLSLTMNEDSKTFRVEASSLGGIYEREKSDEPPQVWPLALPLDAGAWQIAMESELSVALSQDSLALKRGITLVLKKNGRVGTRRLGLPDWRSLANDVEQRAAAGLDTTNI